MLLNKVLPENFQIKDVDVYIYKLGLIKKQHESKKYKLFRYLVLFTAILNAIKSVISILIYHFKVDQIHQYERLFIWIGDYTFYIPKVRYHINAVVIVIIIQTTAIQILHNKLICNRNYAIFNWIKPFEMLSGKIKPSEIGFTNHDDVREFVKRFFVSICFIKISFI